jgi:hypothetical protein
VRGEQFREKKHMTYRLVSRIPALLAQGLFVCPNEVPVGGKQVGRAVKHRGQDHVGGDEVVEAAPRAGDLVFGRFGREGLEAEHGADVLFAFVGGEVGPDLWVDG